MTLAVGSFPWGEGNMLGVGLHAYAHESTRRTGG